MRDSSLSTGNIETNSHLSAGMNLSQDELDRIEMQQMLDSFSMSFENIEFPEDEMDDEFRKTKEENKKEKVYEASDSRSNSKNSMENFASDSVTAEDYAAGPERFAFETVFENSRNCFNKKTSLKKRLLSLNWVFVPNIGEIPFNLCCEAIGMRPNLLRTRIQYELYRNWIVLSEPIHFMMEPMPYVFEAEILYHYSEAHLKVAKKIWSHPSITIGRLDLFCKEQKIDGLIGIIEALEQGGSIAREMDSCYFTGRNPLNMGLTKRNHFNWSSLEGI